ncbi:MAG: bifunctional ADP-dependent NAD(P)H-hydrate dehydratase/NAD(P)H-hydrate epimerase [Intrasporangium sp.]|uniref:bifunctional ADP-dependent NAD(P)H-hydrate dehydratase/NAD(P)H-hydrate epimerase n=1 Tax=Intrasporangium sp. TaxID=1925024 RepID=UPI00264A36B8|nr:bifunctional ADP-dependent NAD(P)H-hydrate dehydratase/NAD(P)H-hydrate epimerase [Intrasporangium sp.]MDN5796956.1 bifunctional ADP-dependent NAD(P)H-hydrate dehydratase/NAD(P)H-hydrate epimerase [Intrasporangium sp.]
MIRALSIPDVRALEAAAMAGLPDGTLMGRAARGIADVAAARLGEHGGRSVVALVGSGDNGGDALYAAHFLAEVGYPCAAVLVSDKGRSAAHQGGLATVAQNAVVVVAADDPDEAVRVVAGADLVLDGITGIGGHPGLRPTAARLVAAIDEDAWIIAVDLASGLDPEGRVRADAIVWADETVTMGVAKPAHLLPAGEGATGRLTVVDIGLGTTQVPAAVERLTFDDAARLWPMPGPGDDKYSRGVLGIVAGGEHYSGAAVLSVTAAVEAGVGMARYVGPPTPTGLVRAAVPEAVHGPGQVQAWLVGPGLDVESAAADQLAAARETLASDLPVVIDAGGLDLVDGPREAPTLLTPHAGEAARLLTRLLALTGPDGTTGRNDAGSDDALSTDEQASDTLDPATRPGGGAGAGEVSRQQVEADPVGAVRRLAGLTGAVVLLKGSTTIVAGAQGPVRSQADAPAWLATAGAGDVLSGLLGMLLAAGLSPLEAGSLGALVHGLAAERASAGGPLRALAVAHAIPAAVRELLLRRI